MRIQLSAVARACSDVIESLSPSVMPALVAGIHAFLAESQQRQAWMAGTSPAMTPVEWFDAIGIRFSVMTAAAVAVVGGAVTGVAAARAQSYPTRPITLVVPFPPGGSTDVIGRILAERLKAPLGQTVIIENVGGAGGVIGVGRVARAAPDGYTIDIGQWDTHVANGAIYPLTYDLAKDFEPIVPISSNPYMMLARKGMPGDDLKGLIAWLKANPGEGDPGEPRRQAPGRSPAPTSKA